ncbi:MAG: MFS transporter [Halobacteria archaeon]
MFEGKFGHREMDRREKAVLSLTMVTHGMLHVYELSIPLFITIWHRQFGASLATLGTVTAIGFGLFGLGALPGGALADRIGSKKLIVASLSGMSISFLGLSIARSVPEVTLALAAWGISASVYHPSGLSAISKEISNRGKGLALHGIAGNVGIGLGPLATTLLLLAAGWRTVAALLAVPAVAFAIYGFRMSVANPGSNDGSETSRDITNYGPDDSDQNDGDQNDGDQNDGDQNDGEINQDTERNTEDRVSESGSGSNRDGVHGFLVNSKVLFSSLFVVVFTVAVFSGLYYRGITTFLPDLLSGSPNVTDFTFHGLEIKPSRYIYSGLLTVGILGQYTGGYLSNRLPVEKGITVTYGCLGVITLALILVVNASLPILLVFTSLLGFFIFVGQPVYQASVAEYSPEETRGVSYGYTYLGVFGIGALGAAITGYILTFSNTTVLFLVLACFAFVSSASGLYLTLKNR